MAVVLRHSFVFDCLAVLPGEPESGGHVTITHQILASIVRVFWVINLPQSDKRWWEIFDKVFLACYHIS